MFVHEDAEEGADYDVDEPIKLWDITNIQDLRIQERQQRGLSSQRYLPGPNSPSQEPGIRAALHKYLDMMRAPLTVGSSMQRLAGKAGVITGVTSGLGLATLQAMTSEGAAIVAVDRDAARGDAIVHAIRESGGKARFFEGDVAREDDFRRAILSYRATFGSMDIMHNNAAHFVTMELHETSNDQWLTAVQTNLTGVFWGCCYAVEAMRDLPRGFDHQHGVRVRLHRDRRHRRLCRHQVRRHGVDTSFSLGLSHESNR